MKRATLPVKIHCPIYNTEDTVFFPEQIDGEWYINIDSFNGCENNWHGCKECDNCKAKAYAKIFDHDN